MLWRLGKKINREFRGLGISLGIAAYVIDEIETDNTGNVGTIAFKVLEKWMKADKRQDTYEMYNELLDALSKISRNDLVEFVKTGE